MKYQKTMQIIEHLEQIKRRPGMYIGEPNHRHLFNYLEGLYFGLRLFKMEVDKEILGSIIKERGWRDDTSFGPYPYMQGKLTEPQIVTEFLITHLTQYVCAFRTLV